MMRALLAALLLLAAAPGSLRAAEPVTVRGGLHEDFGRIVFDWTREVGYSARIDGGRLIVEFAEPAAFEGALLREGLRGYVAAPQAADDGRSLTLPLAGAFRLKHFRLGPKVVIDLHQAAAGPPAEESAESLPRVRVRGGRHDGFSRLVFDWKEPVGELLEQAPGRARLLFDRPAEFDVSGVDVDRLPQIVSLSVARDGVTLALTEGSRLEIERSGTKVILDVAGPVAQASGSNAAETNPAESKAAESKPTEPKPTESKPAEPKLAEAKTAASTPEVAVEDLSPRSQAPGPAQPAATEGEEAPASPAATAEPGPTPLVPKSMGGTASAAPPETSPAETSPAAPAAAAPAATAEPARGRLTVATDPMPDFLTSRAQGPRAEGFTPVELTFSWDRPAAAAAFRRGVHLWLVFDRPAPRQVVQQITTEAPHLGEVTLMEEASATILRIRAQPTVAPRLSRDGNGWTVDLRPRSPLPDSALAAPVVEREEGGRVRYPAVGAGRMLWVTDPDVGDRLVVVPVRTAGAGLTLPYAFPQFRSLQTHQGIVLQPLTSSIEVAIVRSGVLVRDRNGLLASRTAERRGLRGAEEAVAVGPALLDLEAWRRGGIESFQANRQALQRAATAKAGDRLGLARLELARFFFAHGLESEALGVLQVIGDANPRIALDPQVLLMKGASELQLGDYRAAATTLSHPALAAEREALLWQAALAAQAEDWRAAATGFAATHDLIDPYPRNLRLALGLAAAESFVRTGDLEAAKLQLRELLRDDLDERELAQVKVVQGMLQLASGDPDQARSLWSEARDGPHRAAQARARLALIELGRDEGALSTAAAIAELERLRFAWRGDLFEFTLLRKLANLYVQQNRHRDALHALRTAATSFPGGPVARSAAHRMREIFASIYEGRGDPDVPPLRALAIYQEFMELTPAGPGGDRIIAGLADRLVEVDLLDRAAELLEGQVRYRLEGADKARIGARLALVRLLARKPEASLEALEVSAVDRLEPDLAAQRRQLKARALADLDRPDEALEVLTGDDSMAAEQLRADIHWDRRAWPEAVKALDRLIPLLPPFRPLKEDESKLVVNLATALLLAGDKVALQDLSRRYGSAMAASPRADTFRLLVGDGEALAVSTIADELAKVGVAQDFMASYRERLDRENLSQLN